ncbi:hypothetical protein [Cohnella zeiphila]|uniref:Uncharacterized protein n=1 Tax=Cohnella zeiphila TaxID=2761120 RepID=A0A7X0SP27_9BACL|nr:hypothetical protein [Cohnella zeiphila]MBB6733562.1 hypothetical protein [Cohnella zeiphila]
MKASSFVRKWEKRRTIGKKSYMMRYGLLLIGVGLTLLFTVLDVVSNGTVSYTYLLARLVFFPTIGAMFTGMMWEVREQKYQRLTSGSDRA